MASTVRERGSSPTVREGSAKPEGGHISRLSYSRSPLARSTILARKSRFRSAESPFRFAENPFCSAEKAFSFVETAFCSLEIPSCSLESAF